MSEKRLDFIMTKKTIINSNLRRINVWHIDFEKINRLLIRYNIQNQLYL